ncbi:RNA polymerase sigma-70 factor (ECF subfamily) [Runella defluvii]|uniref:RNA polymerase sigma factor n=1 Tax=Runella defluvii TaxID=370973 RepID=A0A7W5ZJ80_9BACT|nr:RNA polymerase sigma factor [Runella defluvii]MBB3837625.1 RNA polymerase sigma-70 factor (ECF subfamily) [Runella defluvii]
MNDLELLQGLQSRQAVAFRYLVEHYQTKVFNTVLAIVQHPEEAEDVAQEVFMEVYESIDTFRGEAKVSSWIYRIATTKALEAYRKKKAQKRWGGFLSSLFGENNEAVYEPIDFVHPGVELENKERASVLFKAINQLSDNQKIAFTLHHVEGLSYQEITEVMQVSLSSVESLMFRAKTNLKSLLKTYYTSQ